MYIIYVYNIIYNMYMLPFPFSRLVWSIQILESLIIFLECSCN